MSWQIRAYHLLIFVICRDVQSHIDLSHISEAYAARKKKLDILMRDEVKTFVTAIQKSFLSNDEPLSIHSYTKRTLGRVGNRIRRFENFNKWLNEDPIDGKFGYTHSWSSLSATSDGKRIVTLNYQGKPIWYDIQENDNLIDDEQALPATTWKFKELEVKNDNNECSNQLESKHVYKGVEIINGVGSSDTLILLKSRKNFQLQKIVPQSYENTISEQNITNMKADKRNILDGCLLPMGIPGFHNDIAMIDDSGKLYVQNLESVGSSGKKCIGNLGDEEDLPPNQDISWATVQASSTGDYLYTATRKAIKLFDLRSRPRYEGTNSKLFAIPKNRDNELSCEMIGGLLTTHDISENLLYFCSNIRIGAVDKRMPGRVYSQVQLHTSPSFSKKVALPSGLVSFSTVPHNDSSPSRLDYLAAWMPYSSTSHINFPTAIVACFDQSYNYCACRNSNAKQFLPFSLEECQNGDHSDGSRAPLVVRGKPLRIAGPLCCIDFSDDQMTNRISLPCTGFVISKLQGTKNQRSSRLSILSNNIAGDIFMTELAENKGKMEHDSTYSYKSNCYDWIDSNKQGTIDCDSMEQLREQLVKKWWVSESTFADVSSEHEGTMNQIRFGHLKRANIIFKLNPYAYLNSTSNAETQIGYKPPIKKYVDDNGKKKHVNKILIDGNLRKMKSKYTKEYKLALSAAKLLDSSGRVSYWKEKLSNKELEKIRQKKINYSEGSKKGKETARKKYGGMIMRKSKKEVSAKQEAIRNRKRENYQETLKYCPSISYDGSFSHSCPSLRAIYPWEYSGPQGIRSNEQLSGKELDTNLKIPRRNYYSAID